MSLFLFLSKIELKLYNDKKALQVLAESLIIKKKGGVIVTFDDMITLWNKKDDFTFAINSFTDDFKNMSKLQKIETIAKEPAFKSDTTDLQKVEVAALVEDLCLLYGLPLPVWCNKPGYFLPSLHYAWDATKQEHQDYLCSTAPPHFKKRGLCYPSNAFTRI